MAKVSGSGSIVALEDKPRGKCRKWQLRVSLGLDPRTGKYPQRTRVVEGTYTSAKSQLREFIDAIEDNAVPIRTSYTVESYCEHYIAAREAAGDLAPSTAGSMRTRARGVSAHIGRVNMGAVTPGMVADMYAAMREGDTLSGKPASGAYLGNYHAFLSGMFDHAVREGVVAESPMGAVIPPRSDTPERRALTAERARELLSQLDPVDEHGCAWTIALTMGLRNGEICALSWEDVDLEAGVIHVRHSYDNHGNLREPKTEAGKRILPMPEPALEALRAHRDAREADDDLVAPGDPVIVTQTGTRVHPYLMDIWWGRDRVGLGVDGWHLHELRHTYVTLLAEQKVHPKVMQVLAGHSTPELTMQVYTHVNLDAKREAVAAVEGVFC